MSSLLFDRWLAALAGGRYQRGCGALCAETDDGPKWCITGVLADIAGTPYAVVRLPNGNRVREYKIGNGLHRGQLPPLFEGINLVLGDAAETYHDHLAALSTGQRPLFQAYLECYADFSSVGYMQLAAAMAMLREHFTERLPQPEARLVYRAVLTNEAGPVLRAVPERQLNLKL